MNSSSMSTRGVPMIKCEEASPTSEGEGGGGGGGGGAGGGGGGSYNLSVNVNLSAAVTSLLAAETAANTPRTPEILNSLIAMTSPLEQYNNFTDKSTTSSSGFKPGNGNDSNSSMSNGSSVTSPASTTTPSIQKTCSELIKAGLKLSIESKRKLSGSDTDSCYKRLKKEESDEDYDSSHTTTTKSDGLTPEDEERRRRRRERNKIAATKCRMKKRERTVNLVTESEVLESQNIDLKSQLKDLEVQRRQLIDMLSLHTASCMKNGGSAGPVSAAASPAPQYSMLRPYESPGTFPTHYEPASPYIRPESANVLASSYNTCSTPLTGDSSIDTISSLENSYLQPQMCDGEYQRAESVLSLPAAPVGEHSFMNADGYLHKASNLLVIEGAEPDYYEQEVGYALTPSSQHHHYPTVPQDHQTKLNNNINDTCLV